MKKCLLFLLLICFLSISYADRDYDRGGVFFCTTDLSPTAYGRLQQAFKSVSRYSFIGGTVGSVIGSSSIYFGGHYKIGASIIVASGISFISYSYFDNLFGEMGQIFESVLDPLTMSSGSSSTHMNYLPIRSRTLDDQEGEIVSYKHCSILTAKYTDIGRESSLAVGDVDMRSFVQDSFRSTTTIERAGVSAPAATSSGNLQSGTVCTLVKDFPLEETDHMKAKMLMFFLSKAKTTKYEVLSNNCCTVAYDYVVDIGGDTTVIDRSNFNHGIGVKRRFLMDAIKDTLKTAGEYAQATYESALAGVGAVLSFFVGNKEHLDNLEKKFAGESETQDSRKQEVKRDEESDEL